MKMLYLAIFGIIFLLMYIVNGCSYPTSYKAFIPKALDSDYKEYQRLCKEEIGKVIYARPMEDIKKETFVIFREPKISDSIEVTLGSVDDRDDNTYYIYIAGFKYYNSWVKPSFSMHADVKQYVECEPLLYGKNWHEEIAIIKKKASENKEYIGKEYKEKLDKTSIYHYEYNEIYRQIVNFKQGKK